MASISAQLFCRENVSLNDRIIEESLKKPFITVVVPVRNEERYIESTLRQLLSQDYPMDRFEIIVVDGDSDDMTTMLARREASQHADAAVHVYDNPRRLSSSGRNVGVRAAKGDYILIVDGHVFIPSRRLLTDMALAVVLNGARVIGRPQRLRPPNISDFQAIVAEVRASRIGHSNESHIYSEATGFVSPISVAVMYERTLFDEVGMFNEGFDAAEDLEFNYRLERAGHQCFICPKFEVYYYPRETLGQLFKQMRRYGEGRANFYATYPRRFTLNAVIPAAFVLTTTILVILSTAFRPALIALVVLLTAYVAIVLVANLSVFRQQKKSLHLIIPIALVIHFGLGWGMLRGFLLRAVGALRRRPALG